jgi:predicted dehydrogenase
LDESGASYPVTADDSAYATFQLHNGVIVQMNSSWCTRVHRDELLTLHVDGEQGSAVAGLRECSVQLRAETPRAVWNPEIADPNHYLESWRKVPDSDLVGNAFKVQWEMFLRHVLEDAPFPHDFLQAARGMQVVEAGLRSCQDKNWQQIPTIPTEF